FGGTTAPPAAPIIGSAIKAAICSAPYCFRCPVQKVYPTCQLACATELERSIERIGAEHIAAFIAEPIIGAAGGAVVPP
ncbi:hypothetical protein ACT453_58335, partial [Bacillus sp. D-CC]